MQIEFHGDASDTLQNMLRHLAGYIIEVKINNDDENIAPDHLAIFDAKLLGPDTESDWCDSIIVQEFDEETGDGKGEPFSVRVDSITVY